MEPELKALIEAARTNGASEAELKLIVMEYHGLKKKGSASDSDSATAPSSLGSPSTSGTGTQGASGGSATPTVTPEPTYTFEGNQISSKDATLIGQYSDEYEKSYREYIYGNFSLEQYWGTNPQLSKSMEGWTDEEKEQTRGEVIENIIATDGLHSDESRRQVLKGTDREYTEDLSRAQSFSEGVRNTNPLDSDEYKQSRVDTYKKNQSDIAFEKANHRLSNEVTTETSNKVRNLLPAEQQSNPESLAELERYMYKEYQIALDLDGTGYINDKAGRVHVLADTWDGFLSGVYGIATVPGIAANDIMAKAFPQSSAGVIAGVEAKVLRAQQQARLKELKEDNRIALQTVSQKFESGDISGGLADGTIMIGESVPMMAAAIVTGAITKSPAAAAGAVSLMGAGTTYNTVRDEEWFAELNSVQQAAYLSANGIAEGLPALVGANVFNRMRLLAKGAGAATTRNMVTGFIQGTSLGMVEEGVTEGVTAGIQYLTNIQAKGEEFNAGDFNRQVKDGWWGGVIMAGGLSVAGSAAGGGLKGAQMAFSSLPSLRSKIEIKKLEQQYAEAKSTTARSAIGEKLNAAIQEGSRQQKRRRAFYENLEANNPEAYNRITTIQKKIAILGVEHNRLEDKEQQKVLRKQINSLVSERAAVEAEHTDAFNLNTNKETTRILESVAQIDNDFEHYGELFDKGSDSVEVTGDNVDSVSEAIEEAAMSHVNLKLPFNIGVISSPKAVKKGLQNAMKIVKALSKTTGFKKLVVHRTMASMQNATDTAAKGMYVADGEIHILAPALAENTAYHEAYHAFVLQELGDKATQALALELEKGLSGELRTKYAKFLEDYKIGADRAGKTFSELLASDLDFADEFLMELLADITNEDVSIQFKKGLARIFTSFIAKGLNASGLVDIPVAKLEDIVRAIQSTTGQLREGKSPEAIKAMKSAMERMGYTKTLGSLMEDPEENEEGKQQAFETARFRDIEQTQDAGQYAEAMELAVRRQKEEGSKLFLQVTMVSKDEAQEILDEGGKIFMAKDGMSGAYLNKDGHMGGLFKNPDSKLKGVAGPTIEKMVEAGGKSMDAFGTKLESMYVAAGFKPVSRVKFNVEYAPEGWDAADSPLKGQPDLVLLVKGKGKVGDGPVMPSYESAYQLMTSAMKGKAQTPLIPELNENAREGEFESTTGFTFEELEKNAQALKIPNQGANRTPSVVTMLERYADGEVTQQEYIDFLRAESPIHPFESVPDLPSVFDIASALGKKVVKGVLGVTKNIPDGYYTGLRLDIPSYNDYNVWTVSAHQGKRADARTPHIGGKVIGYGQAARITNVSFDSTTKAAFNIATKKSKSTIARMFGDWVNQSPTSLHQEAVEIMNSSSYNADYKEIGIQKGWIQVGMNPHKHSWFYDKRDGRPIVAASEVIQVGALVLARNTEKVSYQDPRFDMTAPDGRTIKFQSPLRPNSETEVGILESGTGLRIDGNEEVTSGSVSPTIYIANQKDPSKSRFLEDFRLGEFTSKKGSREHITAANSKHIGKALMLADGAFTYKVKSKSTGVVTVHEVTLPYKNTRAANKIKSLQAEIAAKGSTKAEKAEKEILLEKIREQTRKVYKDVHDVMAQNILALYDSLDPTFVQESKQWYEGANRMANKLAQTYNVSLEQAASVIAALSPQNPWFNNVSGAERVFEILTNHSGQEFTQEVFDKALSQNTDAKGKQGPFNGRLSKIFKKYKGYTLERMQAEGVSLGVQAEFLRALDHALIPKAVLQTTPRGKFFGFDKAPISWNSVSEISKAIDLTRSNGDISLIQKRLGNGNKVRNFFNNIVNPKSESPYVTADTHAFSVAIAQPASSKVAQGAGLFAGADSSLYSLVKEAYITAAEVAGILPREMQSITWEAQKNGVNDSSRTRQQKSDNKALLEELLKDKTLTPYERATTIIAANRSKIANWAESRGIETQKGVSEIRDGARDRADGRISDIVSLRGGAGRDVGNPAAAVVSRTVKRQGNLDRLVADFLDKKYADPNVKTDNRKKNPVTLTPGKQLSPFVLHKKEILELLRGTGLTPDAALSVFNRAKAFKEGRITGKREAMRTAKRAYAEGRKLSTQAQNLRDKLESLRDKSKTVNEFLTQVIALIEERMPKANKTPFSKGQLTRLIKIIRQAHRTSTKKVDEQGLEAMQTFIDRISSIFDQQDAKVALEEYLTGIGVAKKLQSKLAKLTKPRKKGESLKGTATYNKIAARLASIQVELLPAAQLQEFTRTVHGAISSVSKSKAVFDKVEEAYVGVAPTKIKATDLDNFVSNFQALEAMGRQAVFAAKAHRLAAKNDTTFEEEFDNIMKHYERSRLTSSRKAILNFIDKHNEANPNDQLDPANPADIERVLDEISKSMAETALLKKEAVINDIIIPRVAANLEKLLQDWQIREILGIETHQDFDADVLRERLNRLNTREVVNLDYKLDDYALNDSVYGLGYLHSLIKGKFDYADAIRKLKAEKKVASSKNVFLKVMDNVDSFMRMLIVTNNITFAKFRIYTGFAEMERMFAKADTIHSEVVERLNAKRLDIEAKGGSLSTRLDGAIMQMFSMARQIPEGEGPLKEREALWYSEMKATMGRTLEEMKSGKNYSDKELKEFEDASKFLFDKTSNLSELIEKVETKRSDLLEFVDYMSDVHAAQRDYFEDYVNRYLGKELVYEDYYTPFDIRTGAVDEDIESMLKLRRDMKDGLQSSSLSHAKKVAGSSFERNKRSLAGKNTIGLDFIRINERALRENIILSNTVGAAVTSRFAMSSEAMAELIPDKAHRRALEAKMLAYIQQDTSKTPDLFSPHVIVGGFKVTNLMWLTRQAVLVKAFGGFIVQTLKQTTVLDSVLAQTNNKVQAAVYLGSVLSELTWFSAKTGFVKDSKLALDKGRYKLLKNSPVFSRDYEAGNIDPFTGQMVLDESSFHKFIKFGTDLSLKNLKGTDKLAAIASWFTFYGDALISEGVVDSYAEIDWEQEAAKPNTTALSFADTMVTKDQSSSTARQASDIHQTGNDAMSSAVWVARNFVLPFSRFAINKKRSVVADGLKMTKGTAVKEGSIAMVGHVTELTRFALIGKMLLPYMATMLWDSLDFLLGDDEEREEKEQPKELDWKSKMYGVLGQVVVDLNPLPPLAPIDIAIKSMINKYVLFPAHAQYSDDFYVTEGDSYDERYERWKAVEGGIPIYSGAKEDPEGLGYLLSFGGPYGDFLADAGNTLENLMETGNKVISPSGKEYYVRPEDKKHMDLHFLVKTVLLMSQLGGFSSKEIDLMSRKMDDQAKEGRLSSEEALAAYEAVVAEIASETNNKRAMDALKGVDSPVGLARLERLVAEHESDPLEQEKIVNRFSSNINKIGIEAKLKETYPKLFNKYVREARYAVNRIKDSKTLFTYMRSKEASMTEEEYNDFDMFMEEFVGSASQEKYLGYIIYRDYYEGEEAED